MIAPSFYTKSVETTAGYGKFIMEPLPLSFGNSVGNALRRTLLSSLEGTAVTQVRVKGAPHLFTTIPGIKESVLDIVLNLKQLRFASREGGQVRVHIEAKGPKKLFGRDVSSTAKVTNGDLYIAEITDSKAAIDIEAIVSDGVGQISADEQTKEQGFFAVNGYFSPVTKVNFKVEEARVGRKTNFDRLILELWTDETISAEEAVRQAASILASHFGHIMSGADVQQTKSEEADQAAMRQIDKKLQEVIIDELNLPSRVINALLRENIETVADLVVVGREKLIGVKGLGKKSFVLIEDELKKLGITLDH